ncbi:inositol-trisphosphate 3-kinase A [Trichomycterus rosablanca]|uniref:inositol-trisphosphate 3-kinase A n=1 Tax=Trichomycterus rosablanca TaxID=2290929 RepID=UPI002F35C86B
MPKERRRCLREVDTCSSSSDRTEAEGQCASRRASNERWQMAGALPVPQLTVTAEGESVTRELEDAEELNGGATPHRKHSNSSISSAGSSGALDESEDDILSDSETKSKGIVTLEHLGDSTEVRPWSKLKTVVQWHVVTSQRKRLSWVQLAGHKGSFKAGKEGTILKKYSENEKLCFERLKTDVLNQFVPVYHGTVERDGELFLQMSDLLANFNGPNVMDCKMGVRTYLEEELVRAREKPKLRRDLYNKMMEVDREAPTAEEQKQQAVTKLRYMQWRETLSSTSTLGFRIEGIKKADGTCSTDFKKTGSKEEVKRVFMDFVSGNGNIISSYIRRLEEIKQILKASEFFMTHEVIGSSMLFIHDHTGQANVWLIDFGKTTALPEGQKLDHYSPWQEGNRHDGYLFGLDNLLHTLHSLSAQCS